MIIIITYRIINLNFCLFLMSLISAQDSALIVKINRKNFPKLYYRFSFFLTLILGAN